MAIEKTIKLQADFEEALKKLDKLNEKVEDLGKTTKKTEQSTGKLESGFKGVGLALKAMGVGLALEAFNKLSEALTRNEVIADGLETAFNSIGVAFKLVTDALVKTYNAVAESSGNFDALGQVLTNLLNIAITPLKLAFQGIKLGIQSAMLAWEQSFLGGKGKDIERIAELRAEIDSTKQAIQDTAQVAWDSGKVVVKNFGEAVGEVVNIANTATEEFGKVFEDVTVQGIIEQGKAITETRKNYGLLELQQQRLIEQYDREAELLRQQRDDVTLSIEQRIEANRQLGETLKEQNIAEQEAIDNQISALQQRIALEGQSVELSNEIFALETEKLAVQAKVAGFESEQLINENALLEEQKNLKKTLNEQELEKVKIVTTTMGQIADAIGKDTKAGKALAIAQALINTHQAFTKALAQGGIFGAIAGAGILATGMAQVRAIRNTDVSGSTPPSTTPTDLSISTTPETESGISGMIPNLENITGVGTGEMQPVQAFVVENDISNAQALQEELDIQATL
tara:strand:- start:50 stop:1591 length:1542 start_codon:yes stop_codon:yes gene_type:complete